MASIKQLADGAWQVRYRDADGVQRARRFRRKVDADRHRTETEHALLHQTYVDQSAGRIAVAEWWATWSANQAQWSPTTHERHLSTWAGHIEPRIGRREIGSVRHSDLQAIIKSSGLAPNTQKLLRSLLSAMFRAAVRDRLIAASPADALKVTREDVAEARPLSDDEIDRLLEACTAAWERAWVTLGLATGVRVSEGLAVRLSTVDFLRREIAIGDQARTPQTGPVELAPLKNHKPRRIPLTASLGDVLARHIEVHGTGAHGVLFPGADGGLCRRQAATHRFAAIVKRAGLDPGISWHNLRDTAATNMLRDGLNPKYVATVIGNTLPVLLERYAGEVPGDVEAARTSLERLAARAVAS